ncbi:MAG: hypothetical protein JNK81_04035 [Anaerolineales bacterium]|nr:hypothetical protein [Anaerolineales bacterium]
MTKKIFCLIFTFITIGCNASITPQPVPSNFEEHISGATQIAIITAPTPIDVFAVPTAEPFDLETQVIFRDDFNRQLKSGWVWLNERADNWSLETQPGFLQINAISGYFKLGNASNILLFDAPQDNFVIETSLIFDPEDSEQFAGLIALDSNQNFIQAGIGYCAPVVGCVGRGLYADIYQNGNLTLPRNATTYTGNNLFMRLVFQNQKMTLFTSQDNFSWYRMFEKELSFDVSQVGLIAAQNNYIEVIPPIALFDYFEVSLINP